MKINSCLGQLDHIPGEERRPSEDGGCGGRWREGKGQWDTVEGGREGEREGKVKKCSMEGRDGIVRSEGEVTHSHTHIHTHIHTYIHTYVHTHGLGMKRDGEGTSEHHVICAADVRSCVFLGGTQIFYTRVANFITFLERDCFLSLHVVITYLLYIVTYLQLK